MTHCADPQPVKSLRKRLPWALACLGLCTGGLLIQHGMDAPTPPPQPSAAEGFTSVEAAPAVGEVAATSAPPKVPAMAPATPTRVRITAIGVNAPLTALALQSNGHLAAPTESNRNLAGWYRNGTAPGAAGTAVIAGHVDTQAGPAVFYNLGALKKGMTVDVDRADHTTAVFSIDEVVAYSASEFPSRKVYGGTTQPELRLITCGAGFDKARHEYLGNVVVYAHLTAARKL
ncbi:class F sortase [Streptacidiphilus cavernicola]|uniref:Class F sortase n=1 Tax=Streptacidiphilus cavernicola TaxID=3342716 RepID=A0ABV6VYI2_9ACTN